MDIDANSSGNPGQVAAVSSTDNFKSPMHTGIDNSDNNSTSEKQVPLTAILQLSCEILMKQSFSETEEAEALRWMHRLPKEGQLWRVRSVP